MSIPTYTYTCNDGFSRTRCADHIEGSGKYAPQRKHGQWVDMTVSADGRPRCYACLVRGVDTHLHAPPENDHD